ncbi:GNAT family N-acetyltransferase [candidate division WOR-3 bacterium]|nr:GNAT family N-acetyltransferase [candidate division WOR-3 bacterium]
MREELIGEKVRLRPLREADLPSRAQWTADDELASLMGVDVQEEPFISPEHELQRNVEWLEGRHKAGATVYAIEGGGRYIGDIDITVIGKERKAQLTLFIGDRSQWRKGYGTETVRLVLESLVSDDIVDTVEVDVPAGNDRGLAFWGNLGFQHYSTDANATRWLRWRK